MGFAPNFRFTKEQLASFTDKQAPIDGGDLPPDLLSRVSRQRTRMLRFYPFFGALACRFRFRLTNKALAAVSPDGVMYINPAYAAELSDQELAGVIVHEVLHPALHHFTRRKHKHPVAWNIAGDYAINAMIAQQAKGPGAKWVSAGALPLYDAKYEGWTVDAIYDDMMKNAIKVPGYVGDMLPEDSPGGKATPDREDYWRRAVVSAAQTHERMRGRGSLPAGVNVLLKEIREPEIPWQVTLSQYIGDNYAGMDYGYRRVSRRQGCVGAGIVLAAPDKTTAPQVIVLIDTSGSMSEYNRVVISEVSGIAKALNAPFRVVFCDAEVQGDVTDARRAEELLDKFKGGGGSDFRPAFEHIRSADKRNVIIAATDGYIGVPETDPGYQGLVWLVTPNGEDPTGGRYGRVIKLKGVNR